MPSSSVAYTLRTNLKTLLIAREDLSGVQVNSYPPGPDDLSGLEFLFMGDTEADQAWEAMGWQRDETATLNIHIEVRKPGDGDTVAASAESRAMALLAEVEDQLKDDPTVNSAVLRAELDGFTVENGFDDLHRVCQVTARVSYLAEIAK